MRGYGNDGAGLDEVDLWVAATEERAARSAAVARELGMLRSLIAARARLVEATEVDDGLA
jgi:hypothetical protein